MYYCFRYDSNVEEIFQTSWKIADFNQDTFTVSNLPIRSENKVGQYRQRLRTICEEQILTDVATSKKTRSKRGLPAAFLAFKVLSEAGKQIYV